MKNKQTQSTGLSAKILITVFIMYIICLFILLAMFNNPEQKEFRKHNLRVNEIFIEANKAREDKFCELYRQEIDRVTQVPPAYRHCFEEGR